MKMTDEGMADLVTMLRNKSHMARFNADEVAAVLRVMEDNGFTIAKTEAPKPVKVVEPEPEKKVAPKAKAKH